MTAYVVIWGLTLIGFGTAAWFGGWPERLGGAVLLVGTLLSTPVQNLMIDDFRWAVASLDAAALVGLTVLALRYDRHWLIAAAGLQLAVVLTHMAALGPSFIMNWTAVTIRLVTWCTILLVFLFAAYEAHIVRRYGLDVRKNDNSDPARP